MRFSRPNECGRDAPAFQHQIFHALTALGEYERTTALFQPIILPGREARDQLEKQCSKYVMDTLEAGRVWHPPDREPRGRTFLPMMEADLLIVLGKASRGLPNGEYIAFVRDCRARRLGGFGDVAGKRQSRPLSEQEIWIIRPEVAAADV